MGAHAHHPKPAAGSARWALPRSAADARPCLCHGHTFLAWQLRCANAVAAGGRNQRRSQRQQGKAPAAVDKGKDCEYVTMQGEFVQRVVEVCVSWPDGRAGELQGVVQLLGGGMMKARGST